MEFLLCLVAICLSPQGDVVHDQVDVIEVNHLYDTKGEHVFDQLIFWEPVGRDGKRTVRDWRLLKVAHQTPTSRHRDGLTVVTWTDGSTFRQVTAENICETWTQYDPELVNRAVLPLERRRGLGVYRKETGNGDQARFSRAADPRPRQAAP